MRGQILFVFSIVFAFHVGSVQAQIDSSFCNATDSVKALYQDDADQLALRRVLRNQLNSVDSAVIPAQMSDVIMQAMLALHNTSSLPARDTVLDMLNIHTLPTPSMDQFSIYVGTTTEVLWMQHFQLGDTVGVPAIDSLINTFDITLDHGTPGYIRCYTGGNYNLEPIMSAFLNVAEVWSVEPDMIIGSGPDIQDSVHTDHVQLIYKYGWPWCGAGGCPYERFWEFKVYYDCTVEYVGSYGDVLLWTSIEEDDKEPLHVYPNPFNHCITLSNAPENAGYVIYNVLGVVVAEGKLEHDQILGLGSLARGSYYLTVLGSSNRQLRKVVLKH